MRATTQNKLLYRDVEAHVFGARLNSLDLSRQFKRVPTRHACIK